MNYYLKNIAVIVISFVLLQFTAFADNTPLATDVSAQDTLLENTEFIVIGDMPYGEENETKFLNLINTINQEQAQFVVHVGDIKSGTSFCSAQNYRKIKRYFKLMNPPLIYTPGDNEWTDCHRLSAGAYDPVERLERLREIFYLDPEFTPEKGSNIERQCNGNCDKKQPVENQRWQQGNVTFATLHVVGSQNNIANTTEYNQRYQQVSHWVDETEKAAAESDGLVLFMHADPMFDAPAEKRPGFEPLLQRFKQLALDYEKPILLIHGDSHHFKIDFPFRQTNGDLIQNFQRLIVFGENDIAGVKISINPNTQFNIQPVWTNFQTKIQTQAGTQAKSKLKQAN